jgi:hypothetical protein
MRMCRPVFNECLFLFDDTVSLPPGVGASHLWTIDGREGCAAVVRGPLEVLAKRDVVADYSP